MIVGVLSDAHGNLEAFDTALDLLHQYGADQIRYLGDAVGYIPSLDVLRRLREAAVPAIAGNHEALMLSGDYAPETEEAYQLQTVRKQMDVEELAYVQALPQSREEVLADRRCLFIHGSPSDHVFGYVYPDTDLGQFANSIQGVDVVFMGNTHRPFVRQWNDTHFVNVGSCGLPRGDDVRGALCLYDTVTGRAQIKRYGLGAAARRVLSRYRVHSTVARRLEQMAAEDGDGAEP